MYASRLTFIRKMPGYRGLFACSCGNEVDVYISNIKRGTTLSCGCLAAELRATRKTNSLKRRLKRHCEDAVLKLTPLSADTAVSLSGVEYQRCEQGDFPLYEFFIDGGWWTGIVPEPRSC